MSEVKKSRIQMDKLKIKEAIIVEGRDDAAVLHQVTDALIIETHGFGIKKSTWNLMKKAHSEKGLIILTDPDFSGEKIRKRISKVFPDSKHAYMPRKKATKAGDIGIENSTPEDVASILLKVCTPADSEKQEFTLKDMDMADLAGSANAKELREITGEILGIGYGNVGSFVKKLNGFGISREAFSQAVAEAKKRVEK